MKVIPIPFDISDSCKENGIDKTIEEGNFIFLYNSIYYVE